MSSNWLSQDNKLTRVFTFPDFQSALDFVNKVGELVEQEAHHPDIHIFYNQVKLELWTHTTNSITEKDFALSGKIDSLE